MEQGRGGQTAALKVGAAVPFEVIVDGGKLVVRVADRDAVAVDLGNRTLDGAWGLGAQAGSAGLWSGVTAE